MQSFCRIYSALILAALTTFAYLSISSRIKPPNNSGGPPIGSTPSPMKRSSPYTVTGPGSSASSGGLSRRTARNAKWSLPWSDTASYRYTTPPLVSACGVCSGAFFCAVPQYRNFLVAG